MTETHNNIEMAILLDGTTKEEASSPQNSALVIIGTGPRHRNSRDGEEEAPPPAPKERVPLAGSQGDDVESGLVGDVPEEPMIPDDARSEGDNEDTTNGNQEEGSHPPPGEAGAGLAAQALMALIIGTYKDNAGSIIAFIGLGTITSTIGGLFTRGPPTLFQGNKNDDDDVGDALTLYYKCLPAFFIVGVLELCYGFWVSRNQEVRAGKLAKTILMMSAILLVVTICFTGAGAII